MSEAPELSKEELLARIDETWPALLAALEGVSAGQHATIRDDAGWSVTDHVLHLAAWERSAVNLLQGRPRHTGLGIEEAVYLSRDVDRINTAVFEQHAGIPPEDALAQLRGAHAQMMALLGPLSEADLFRPYSAYLPDEPGRGEGPPAINVVYGDTAAHFAEHLEWIETMLAK